jgi:hypothetical protein
VVSPISKSALAITVVVIVVPLALLVGCVSSYTVHRNQVDMPVVILEHADGSQDWGRVLFVSNDSLSIRRVENMQPLSVDASDVVRVYRVERLSPNYLLAFGAGTVVLAASWGLVVGLNNGDTSTGSFLVAGAVGAIPAALVGVKVSDWTRHYKIVPMNVIGPDGRLDLRLLHLELVQTFLQ